MCGLGCICGRRKGEEFGMFINKVGILVVRMGDADVTKGSLMNSFAT